MNYEPIGNVHVYWYFLKCWHMNKFYKMSSVFAKTVLPICIHPCTDLFILIIWSNILTWRDPFKTQQDSRSSKWKFRLNINPSQSGVTFLCPWKHQKTCCFAIPPENIRKPEGFLMFSGGIEKQHGAIIG